MWCAKSFQGRLKSRFPMLVFGPLEAVILRNSLLALAAGLSDTYGKDPYEIRRGDELGVYDLASTR